MKVIIYADGGSRGNPGVAGSGTVVYAEDGSTILREIVYVVGKKSTNNVAEYHGLLRGLEAAAELGATEVEIHMDSKLVVEQINGRWKIKHPDMQELALKARKIIAGFDAWSLDWVPRNQNKVADKLSNDAMDACAAGKPVGIINAAADNPAEDSAAAIAATTNAPAEGDAGSAIEPKDFLSQRGTVTRFILLRHGQTQMSVDKVYSGRTDARLTEFGRDQAAAAAQALAARLGTDDACGIDAIVSSPLARCTETASVVSQALGRDVTTEEGLIELDFGAWEGKTFDQAHGSDPELHADWLSDTSVACPEGESLRGLHQRVRTVRKKLQEHYAGQTVLVVTHVNPIKSFLRQALDAGPATFNRMFVDVASLSACEFWDDGSLVRTFNDVGHLAGLE